MDRSLITVLKHEKSNSIKSGIYNKIQVDFAFNSNHLEGSKLSHDQTRYIFETRTVGTEPARVEDIIETVNHFRCFDYIIDTFGQPITEDYIKELHRILKSGTYSSENSDAVIGDYKKYPNHVGDIDTSAPKNVQRDISKLLNSYEASETGLYKIIDFHAEFEKIHPFYDGNGRVGRLLMFKECLRYNIVPFVINDLHKSFYYNGLKQWQTGKEKGYLIDTCLLMQDDMKEALDYFEIDYDKKSIKSSDILKEQPAPKPVIVPKQSHGRER